MKWIIDLFSILGLPLTAIGTYFTIKSGVGEIIIKDELLRYGSIVLTLTLFGTYHYYKKYEIAKSVIRGRKELNKAHINALKFNDNLNKNQSVKLEKCITEFSNICQHLCTSLSRFHNVTISACISYVSRNSNDNKAYTNTLSRDINSSHQRQQVASIYNTFGYISENTDFSYIFESIKNTPIDEVYYFNNSIPLNLHYKNSHLHESWKKHYYSWYGLIPRIFNWKLPYRSTIVVPIVPINNQKQDSIEGFLCVDCPRMWVFSEKYDVPILKELASSLHPAMKNFNRKRNIIMNHGYKKK